MELKQEWKQSQVLSARMMQSVSMLQMNSQELREYLEQIVLENPVIDMEEPERGNADQERLRKLEWLEETDRQNLYYYEKEEKEYEVPERKDDCLQDFLLLQLRESGLEEKDRQLVEFMILSLEEDGYLRDDMEEICRELEITPEEGERALGILQSMEPKGVGARNFQECLLLQLEDREEDKLAEEIVRKYLEDLGKNRISAIARRTGRPVGEVQEACGRIMALNPKPGNSFGNREYRKYLEPDVTVVKLKDHFEILINDYMYPRITMNSYYISLMKEGDSPDVKEYLSKKVQQAEWISKCLVQRNSTLLQVAGEIVGRQILFFEKGKGYLVPLSRKEVAEKIGIHESTVSRAVKGKYLQCSWGIFPLSYFFMRQASSGQECETVTIESVKQKLKDLIEGENKEKPFSDRILSEKLKEQGITISRRTVAKYREALGIREASGRKEFK